VQENVEIQDTDAESACLDDDIQEEIYMKQRLVLASERYPNNVLNFTKSLLIAASLKSFVQEN
jgi:hypothetical protein